MGPREASWVEGTFGRFAWRESTKRPGAIEMLGEWERQNIVEMTPPLALRDGNGRPVRRIRCHRLIVVPLRGVLEALADDGLGHLVNTFDGCFVPRHMCWEVKRPLSRHSWGIAVDVNARLFPYGSHDKQDKRLIAAFEQHGFAWGGEWRTPDPMHFEMARLRDPKNTIQILLDGEKLATGFLEEGRVMGPVREVAEALGGMVEARLEEGEVVVHSPVKGGW